MSTVIVERRFERPVNLDFLGAAEKELRWCLDIHRCSARFQSLDADGLSSLCVYEAPDAEAMRRMAAQARAPEALIWGATVHVDPDGPPQPETVLRPGEHAHAIVDRSFPAPVVFEELMAREAEHSSCLVMHRVRYVCSMMSLDRRRMACLYAAPDVEAVRQAVRMSGLPYDTVRTAAARA